MAQLKLMKKEWFAWFDKTFLDNITAWTEYYYINPDSQHWISNNLIEIDDIDEMTANGVTCSVKNGVISLKGTATASGTFNIPLKSTLTINGTIILKDFGNIESNLYLNTTSSQQALYNILCKNEPTTRTLENISYFRFIFYYVAGQTYDQKRYPMLVQGSTAPGAFSPNLIKIEDVLTTLNLGDLTWTIDSYGNWVSGNLQTAGKQMLKCYCSKYPIVNEPKDVDYGIRLNVVGEKIVLHDKDTLTMTPSELKSYVNGVEFIYLNKDSPIG